MRNMKKLLLALTLAWLPSLLWASGNEQTHQTVPAAGTTFLTDLQNFLKREDAQRFGEQFAGFIVSGGTHGTSGTLSATPSALVAYPGGYYVTETGAQAISYLDNTTCWVVVHKDNTGAIGGTFSRVGVSHFGTDCVSGALPTLPASTAFLMQVTTSGGQVTAVVDRRTMAPAVLYFKALTEFPAAGSRGRLILLTSGTSSALYFDTGTVWIPVTTATSSTFAALPAAGTPGRVILVTDVGGGVLYYDTGTVWTALLTGLSQTEIDFGSTSSYDGTFTVTDARVTPATVRLAPVQSAEAATGREQDENEMEPVFCRAAAGSGQFTMYCTCPEGCHGKVKVNYTYP